MPFSPTNKENPESKQTITKSTQEEAALHKIFSSMTDMFASLGIIYFSMELTYDENGKPVDGIFSEVNPATERLLGKSREQLIGKSRKELFGKVFDELPEKFDVIIKTGKSSHFESYGAGLQKYYDIYAWKIAENQVSVIFEDITERKKAEEEVKSSKLLLESVFNSMYEGVFILDKTGKVIDFNDAFCRINRFKNREETLKSISSLGTIFKAYRLDGSYVPVEEWPATKALRGELGNNQEYIVERTDLDKRWITSNSYAPLRNEKGDIVGAIQTMHDITQQKKAEGKLLRVNEELEERVRKRTEEVSNERQRLYNVLETLPAYVILLDKDYRVPFANKVFRESFGESHGRRCHEYLFKLNSPCANCETYKVLKTHKFNRWEWTGPNGHVYDIYDYPFVEADGSMLILEMGIDITERKKAEQQALESANKLKDAERLAAIGATAGMVGHDIRNPLQAITGDLYLAKTELPHFQRARKR